MRGANVMLACEMRNWRLRAAESASRMGSVSDGTYSEMVSSTEASTARGSMRKRKRRGPVARSHAPVRDAFSGSATLNVCDGAVTSSVSKPSTVVTA